MSALNEADKNHLNLLLTPSWLSGLLAVSAGLIITIGVIVVFSLHTSGVQQQLTAWQINKPQRALTTPDEVLAENDRPSLSQSWPLVVVWAGIGLAVYAVAAAIVRSLSNAEDLRESLDYVNARPHELLKETIEHAALRFAAAILLVALTLAMIKKVLPYCITASHASAGDILSPVGILYMLLSFAVLVISLHIETILLRLTLGRVRIF